MNIVEQIRAALSGSSVQDGLTALVHVLAATAAATGNEDLVRQALDAEFKDPCPGCAPTVYFEAPTEQLPS